MKTKTAIIGLIFTLFAPFSAFAAVPTDTCKTVDTQLTAKWAALHAIWPNDYKAPPFRLVKLLQPIGKDILAFEAWKVAHDCPI